MRARTFIIINFILAAPPALAQTIERDAPCAALGIEANDWQQWRITSISPATPLLKREPRTTTAIALGGKVPPGAIVEAQTLTTVLWDRPAPAREDIMAHGLYFPGEAPSFTITHREVYRPERVQVTLRCHRIQTPPAPPLPPLPVCPECEACTNPEAAREPKHTDGFEEVH